jgi:hypothetical protein
MVADVNKDDELFSFIVPNDPDIHVDTALE